MTARQSSAVVRVAAVEVDCPKCGSGIGAPDNGSYCWPVDLLQRTITCGDCGASLTIPKRYLETANDR